MNIVLTGMMGTGKSTVGKKLASVLGMEYIDVDEMIEKDTGKSINKIFENDGEEKFREIEKKAVKVVSLLNNHVVSTGGGVVKDSENMEELEKNSVVICLRARPEIIYERTKKHSNRPLLKVKDPEKAIKELMSKREKFYKRCDLMVDTSEKKVDEIVKKIIDFIKAHRKNK
ncbi:MAG: shikimate kinase [Elusimicrobiota bacterium]